MDLESIARVGTAAAASFVIGATCGYRTAHRDDSLTYALSPSAKDLDAGLTAAFAVLPQAAMPFEGATERAAALVLGIAGGLAGRLVGKYVWHRRNDHMPLLSDHEQALFDGYKQKLKTCSQLGDMTFYMRVYTTEVVPFLNTLAVNHEHSPRIVALTQSLSTEVLVYAKQRHAIAELVRAPGIKTLTLLGDKNDEMQSMLYIIDGAHMHRGTLTLPTAQVCSHDGSNIVGVMVEPTVDIASEPWDGSLCGVTESILKETKPVIVVGGHDSFERKLFVATQVYGIMMGHQLARNHVAARLGSMQKVREECHSDE